MTKLIVANRNIAKPGAPRIIRTPGVGGYDARFIASHLDLTDGSIISSWKATAGANPFTIANVGGTPAVSIGTENGIRHLNTLGGSASGGRLLGPHTTQRPFTIAAVVKAPPNTSPMIGFTGTYLSRNSSGYYQGTSSTAAYTPVLRDGWIFVMMAHSADANSSFIARADDAEVVGTPGSTPSPSFGGLYFGSTAAGGAHQLREMILWPTQLNLSDRNKVHNYMRSRYPELV
ncbi:hypothetical protein SEA_ARCADIA_19 [Arthrobacter phage Arcadia]|uniref:Uncharacterized protein n=1 Tax=Arthrobacter phage Arcadia TaxID=2024274 RepID=A0A222Z792_9CAUD|nr:hypothetical protein PQB74_gp19 [Arthrobacter phage Arcadia]ASR79983.1 hypothetical protein SEA_ARCADIA_19 [Arthrobacter phage Arcadia]ASR80176.1 hypothetical protein SEA_ELSA_19 [Arthrobacter phage Elsa]ASR80373.1 hypothetical protein SEA_NASON_19 [Arthrobacter phage Nason]